MDSEVNAKDVAKFRRACKALDELGRAGYRLYLANDTLNLMTCAPGETSITNRQDSILEEYVITGASGGDW